MLRATPCLAVLSPLYWLMIIFIVDIHNDGELTSPFTFVVIMPNLHSFSLNFGLLTLLLFHIILFEVSVVLFSSFDLIAPSPLISGDPDCRHHELPYAYPLDYFPTALQFICSSLRTSLSLYILAPFLEGRIVVVRGLNLVARFLSNRWKAQQVSNTLALPRAQ